MNIAQKFSVIVRKQTFVTLLSELTRHLSYVLFGTTYHILTTTSSHIIQVFNVTTTCKWTQYLCIHVDYTAMPFLRDQTWLLSINSQEYISSCFDLPRRSNCRNSFLLTNRDKCRCFWGIFFTKSIKILWEKQFR